MIRLICATFEVVSNITNRPYDLLNDIWTLRHLLSTRLHCDDIYDISEQVSFTRRKRRSAPQSLWIQGGVTLPLSRKFFRDSHLVRNLDLAQYFKGFSYNVAVQPTWSHCLYMLDLWLFVLSLLHWTICTLREGVGGRGRGDALYQGHWPRSTDLSGGRRPHVHRVQ